VEARRKHMRRRRGRRGGGGGGEEEEEERLYLRSRTLSRTHEHERITCHHEGLLAALAGLLVALP